MTVRRWALGASEVLRALVPMVVIEISLRTSDLPTTCRRLGLTCDLHSAAPPAGLAVLPRWARRAVLGSLVVVSLWPFRDTCLRRCLLIGHRLRRLDPVLRIGVQRTADGEFSAHSWLEFDGHPFDATANSFAPLTSSGR